MEIKDLAPLKASISKLESQANAVTIESQEKYEKAIDLISGFKDTGSKIKNVKESITKPLNEALQNARKLFAPLEDQLAKAEAILKVKLLDYKRKKDEEARAAEAKIAAKVESGYIKQTTAEQKMATVERVATTTRGAVGEVQVKKIRKVRIINPELVPDAYWVIDEVAVRRDVLNGKEVPGAEVYIEESIAAR